MSPLHILAATLVAFLWGVNFVAVKIGLEHFPPFLMLALRFAAVAALLLPFYPRCTLPLRFIFLMSVFFGSLHFGLLFSGMALGIDIPTAVITVQLGVPFSCLLSAMMFGDRLGPWRSSGMMVAFFGIMVVAGTPHVVQHFTAFLMMMLGAFCWASGNILLKKQEDVNILEMLAWASLFTAPQMLFVSMLLESQQWQLVTSATLPAALAIGFMVLFSTIVAYGLWYYLLKHCPVSSVAPFNLLTPFFGIAAGQLIYPLDVNLQIFVGGMITIIGVAIIVARKPRMISFGRIHKEL